MSPASPKRTVAEVEDAAVGADNQVAVAVAHHVGDRRVERLAAHRSAERRVEGEDAALGRHHVVAEAEAAHYRPLRELVATSLRVD